MPSLSPAAWPLKHLIIYISAVFSKKLSLKLNMKDMFKDM